MKDRLPEALQNTLERAREQVSTSPDHILSPHAREHIYRAIGPWSDSRANIIRGRLGIFAAQHVLFCWRAVWPHDPLADMNIELAEGVLRRAIDPDVAREETQAAWDRLNCLDELIPRDQFTGKSGYDTALFAGIATHMAINEAAGKHVFAENEPWVKESDTDDVLFDGETGDAALWASRAYAGREHAASSSPARREEYWLWWINEALPRSWHSSP
jgi:hypothetical protein